MLALFSQDSSERVMAFLDVDVEEMVRREVLAALAAPVGVRLDVVRLILGVSPERDRFPVARQRAAHGSRRRRG